MKPHLLTTAKSDDPRWHLARTTGIGASEAATAIGLSPWATPHELWAEKVGLAAPQPPSLPMECGTALEPLLASLFERHTGLTLRRAPGVFASAETPFVLASPDGAIDQDEKAGAEFKATSRDLSDGLPVEWEVQAQQQMYVMGWAIIHFGVLVDCRDFQIHHVERDDAAIAQIVDRETEFWRCVELRQPPEFDFSKPGALTAVKAVFRGLSQGQTVDLPVDVVEAWQRSEAAAEQVKALQAEIDQSRAIVLAAIGDAEFGTAPGLRLKRIPIKGGEVKYTREPYIQLRKVKA